MAIVRSDSRPSARARSRLPATMVWTAWLSACKTICAGEGASATSTWSSLGKGMVKTRRVDKGPIKKRPCPPLLAMVLPLGAATQIKANVFEAFKCPAGSMIPTIVPGDRFLVNKTVYNPTPPERGAVVVFRNPEDREIMYVKRVIGVPGDTVAVLDNEVFVNGARLTREERLPLKVGWPDATVSGTLYCETNGRERYLIAIDRGAEQVDDFPETIVPRGACFVLGDNRNNSRDSRFFGFVPFGDVVGRAQYIYFPAQSWSRFGTIERD